MLLPRPRGPLSAALFEQLHGATPVSWPSFAEELRPDRAVLHDPDFQIALWSLYELHYAGFDDVADSWEWASDLLSIRSQFERVFETAVRNVADPLATSFDRLEGDFPERLFALVAAADGPSAARYVRVHATRSQVEEFLIHRSIYTLKEADPHSWCIPRLQGAAKVALVELQFDEYGAGRPSRQHARMFADSLSAVGLDARYGAYINAVPAITLAVNNLVNFFGLHRRLRGAAMGHLAAFEATSSLPARDVASGLHRLGLGAAAGYFDEHVEADAVHEQLAARSICAVMLEEDPSIAEDVALGIAACMSLDAFAGEWLLGHWKQGGSSLAPAQPVVDVLACAGGPALVRNLTLLVDDAGRHHPNTRPVAAVCRCEKSSRWPWCDGTHKILPEESKQESQVEVIGSHELRLRRVSPPASEGARPTSQAQSSGLTSAS